MKKTTTKTAKTAKTKAAPKKMTAKAKVMANHAMGTSSIMSTPKRTPKPKKPTKKQMAEHVRAVSEAMAVGPFFGPDVFDPSHMAYGSHEAREARAAFAATVPMTPEGIAAAVDAHRAEIEADVAAEKASQPTVQTEAAKTTIVQKRGAGRSESDRMGSDLTRYLRIHAKKPYGVRGQKAILDLGAQVAERARVEGRTFVDVLQPSSAEFVVTSLREMAAMQGVTADLARREGRDAFLDVLAVAQ